MKKLIFLFAVVCLTSCVAATQEQDIKSVEYFQSIYKFDYEGHQYILFRKWDISGIVHDPNCCE